VQDLFNGDMNSFVRARKIYKAIMENNSSFAVIYRRPDLKRSRALHVKAAKLVRYYINELFSQVPNPSELNIKQLMDHMGNGWAKHEKEPKAYDNLISTIKKIGLIKIISDRLEGRYNKDIVKKCLDEYLNEDRVEDLSEQAFFGNEDIQDLRVKNVVYHPNIYHTWGSNLAWLLANLKEGKRFIIISDIAEKSNKFRDSNPKEISAFAREICTVLKAGYEFIKEKNMVYLRPSKYYRPEDCVTNGEPDNGVNPSDIEVENFLMIYRK
jgi:hypothetical protein